MLLGALIELMLAVAWMEISITTSMGAGLIFMYWTLVLLCIQTILPGTRDVSIIPVKVVRWPTQTDMAPMLVSKRSPHR